MHIALYLHIVILLIFGLIWILLATYLYRLKKKGFVYVLFFTVFFIYLYKVLDYTLIQFQSLLLLKYLSPTIMLQRQEAGKTLNLIPFITLGSTDVATSLLNILLFIPFGFGFPFISNFRMKAIVMIGALLSICIELLQLLTGIVSGITFRVTDINDVLFNTAGVVVGYMLFIGFMRIFHAWYGQRTGTKNPLLDYVAKRPTVR